MEGDSIPRLCRFALGLRAWIWQNEELAARLQLVPYDFVDPDTQTIAVTDLERLYQLLEGHIADKAVMTTLLDLGVAVEQRGYKDPRMRTAVLAQGGDGLLVTAKVFCPLAADWDAIDGVYAITDDWRRRYQRGVVRGPNSSGSEAALALILRTNLGLVREDQYDFGPISEGSQIWRKALRQAWGCEGERQQQDTWARYASLFGEPRGSVVGVYKDIMQNAPQITGHTILCYVCCDNVVLWEEKAVSREFIVELSNLRHPGDLGTYLTFCFAWQRCETRASTRCTSGSACQRTWRHRTVWLDRPAPTMPVVVRLSTVAEAAGWHAFQDVEWTYATRGGEWRVQYSLNGFIYREGSACLARSRNPYGSLLFHDPSISTGDALRLGGGWTDGVDPTAQVHLLQYEQEGPARAVLGSIPDPQRASIDL